MVGDSSKRICFFSLRFVVCFHSGKAPVVTGKLILRECSIEVSKHEEGTVAFEFHIERAACLGGIINVAVVAVDRIEDIRIKIFEEAVLLNSLVVVRRSQQIIAPDRTASVEGKPAVGVDTVRDRIFALQRRERAVRHVSARAQRIDRSIGRTDKHQRLDWGVKLNLPFNFRISP